MQWLKYEEKKPKNTDMKKEEEVQYSPRTRVRARARSGLGFHDSGADARLDNSQ